MLKEKTGKWIPTVIAGLILGAELALLVDAAAVLMGRTMSVTIFGLLWIALSAVSVLLCRGRIRRILAVSCGIPAVLLMLMGLGYAGWRSFSAGADYEFADAGKHRIYADRKVMVIVPHQDDELNILGGVMEEYVRYGSDVYGVFVTNGDFMGLAETRHREVLAVFDSMGIPADQVVFLGYGDGWQEGGPHIYNAQPGEVMTSLFGRRAVYGTKVHAAYREGQGYTVDNLMSDMKDVILECRPDVIFCSDYDHHIDHKAVTLMFDKVMGQILKENPEYTPVVYKAYAYGTAWEAEADYYDDINVGSTRNHFAEPYSQMPAVYRWEDRVRFPVDGATLSRSLVGSDAFARLALHKSQGADQMAASVINGDKVVWQRHTQSLCLHAGVTVSSGNASLLNDFMLIENHDLADESRLPYDGIWVPEDEAKTAWVTLDAPSDVASVVLYDNPSEEHNVLNARICFDDGTEVETGRLDSTGAGTVIAVDRKAVSSFSVILCETEGDNAGLSEIEAFAEEPQTDGCFIKLTDGEGNFLYDYTTAPDGTAEFRVYTHGNLPELTGEQYTVETAWDEGTAVLENAMVRVTCPAGQSVTVNITCAEAGVSDSVTVRNPGAVERRWNELWRSIEREVYLCYKAQLHKKLMIPSLIEKIEYVIKHMA